MGIHVLYKPIGKTPLEMLDFIKAKKKSYAGRLDPMAHGLLLVLTNEHCLSQNSFHNFDKTYIFELVIGLSTDTYDILGKLVPIKSTGLLNNNISDSLKTMEGPMYQKYPLYSSIRINGKPLWYWAKNDKLDNIEIPGKIVTIYKLECIDSDFINAKSLKKIILDKLILLGDRENKFREKEILNQWKNYNFKNNYKRFKIKAHVSCGTYIRELSQEICKKQKNSGICLDIYREMVGNYKLN